MSESGSEIAEQSVKRGSESTNSRSRTIPRAPRRRTLGQSPTRKNLVPRINVVVHPDKVLVRPIGFDCGDSARQVRSVGPGVVRTRGAGKILKEHRRQTARRRLTTGVRGLANYNERDSYPSTAIRRSP